MARVLTIAHKWAILLAKNIGNKRKQRKRDKFFCYFICILLALVRIGSSDSHTGNAIQLFVWFSLITIYRKGINTMKRLLAALLTISMMVSIAPFSAFAESPGTFDAPSPASAQEEDHSTTLDEATAQAIASDPLLQGQYAPPQQTQSVVDTSDVTMEATDGFGKLLLNSIDEQNDLSSDTRITDVTVDTANSTATVRYVSEQDADLVVALYTDDSEMTMAASGTVDAPAMLDNTGSATATVTLIGSTPNSFKVKAFLLDKDEHAPLCNEYASSAYTKDIQDLDNATTADYPADRVLNLDDDTTTNFAVVNENTVLVDANDASTGAMDITDNGDGSYTITNADDRTKNLQPGENFVYKTDDNLVILCVESTSQSGDDVTLTGNSNDLDLEDIFDVVKINDTADTADFTCEPTTENHSSLDLDHENGFGDIDKGDTFENKKIPIEYTSGSLSVTGTLTGTFGYHLKVGLINKEHYISSSVDAGLTGELTVSGSFHESFQIAEVGYNNPFIGVVVGLKPAIEVNADANLTVGLTITTHNGFEMTGDTFTSTSEEPVIKPILKAEGSLYIGLNLNPEINALWGKIGIHMDARAGATAAFELQKKDTEDSSLESLHTCDFCFSVTLTGSAELTVTVWIGDLKKSHEIYKGDLQMGEAYYSLTYDEFGWGKCPHRSYRVTISTSSSAGDSADYAVTSSSGETVKSGNLSNAGTVVVFLESGNYTVTVTIKGETYTQSFAVGTSALNVKVTTSTGTGGGGSGGDSGSGSGSGYDPDKDSGKIVSQGSCGVGLTFTVTEGGLLTISGNGDMTDYIWNNIAADPDAHPLEWYSVKKVVVEKGVTSIGTNAFVYCSNISEIILPTTIKKIGQDAFMYCEALKSVIIPEGVPLIDYALFAFCSSLESVTIPVSVKAIDLAAFHECTGLKDVFYCGTEKQWEKIEIASTGNEQLQSTRTYIHYNCSPTGQPDESTEPKILYEGVCGKNGNNLKWVLTNDGIVTVSGTGEMVDVGSGRQSWFTTYADLITKAVIEEGVTTVGKDAFYNCENLESVELPESLTEIHWMAFDGCTNLWDITIPDSVTTIGYRAFKDCTSLMQFEVPQSVTNLDADAFYGCSALQQVTLNSGITSLSSDLFYECSALKEIAIPESVTVIDSSAFNSSGLSYVLEIPKNVTTIGYRAFWNCSDLAMVVLPKSLKTIGRQAFYSCANLTDIFYLGSEEEWNAVKLEQDALPDNVYITFASDEENGISYSTPDTTDNAHEFTASFTGLTSGVSYAVIVSTSDIDPLAPENLIYINQVRADSSSYQQSFRTKYNSSITANDMNYVIATGRYAFADDPVPSGSGGSSSGGGGGGAILLGIGVVALVTAGVILTMPVDVQGRAELADHTALPGAKISLLQDGNVVVQTTADENGNFALKAKRGSYELTVVYTDASGQLVHKTTSIKAPAKDLVITF